jgi:ABC-type spermidine/putrescine transport system permease subunit II
MLSGGARRAIRAWTVLILLFLYVPLALVLVNAFNSSRTFAFPPTGFTTDWWVDAWNSEGMWKSLANSVVVGLGATAIALVPAQSGAGHQRGRGGPDPGCGHPGVAGPAVRWRSRHNPGVS